MYDNLFYFFDALIMIIGIDPDSKKHGVALYRQSALTELWQLDTVSLVRLFNQEWYDSLVSIENVCANNFIYSRNKTNKSSVNNSIARKLGRVQQAQIELIRWLDHYSINYVLHQPQKGNWADDKNLFEKVTGWTKKSNKDTRSAAYFGYLAIPRKNNHQLQKLIRTD